MITLTMKCELHRDMTDHRPTIVIKAQPCKALRR